jgi:hypothetical protein
MKAPSTIRPEQRRHHGSGDRGGHGQAHHAMAMTDSRPELEQQQGLLSLMAGSPRLQRKCACGAPSAAGGICAACEEKASGASSPMLQKKMMIGAADDPLEREADRVADQVMAAPARPPLMSGEPLRIQRFTGQVGGQMEMAPASVGTVLAGSGRPLEPALRQDMEQRFGHDFSRVRVHTGGAAETSSRDLDAHAYTLGHHVVFADGRFAPETSEGRRLLAHELTHVVQQSQSCGDIRHVQRGGKKGPTTKPHSCGGWTCAPLTDCPNPDGKTAPSSTASTSWSLTVNLDLDVPTAAEITSGDEVGHAFVEFHESNGDHYTYGHYPGKSRSPDPVFRPEVFGCTAHPDHTHSGCIDMKITFSLSQAEYTKALDFAKAWCGSAPRYNVLTNNCTTFVEAVARVAGKPLPSSRGKVGHDAFTADNPNTLFDAMLSQADNATWRQRVNGNFTGHYDAAGKSVSFTSFELKTNDNFSVAGEYTYTGSTGHEVQGSLDGRLIFNVDAGSKALTPVVAFDWTEPSGTGKGLWTVSATGDIKGTWGRGAVETGGGGWELKKIP